MELLQTQTYRDGQSYSLEDHGETHIRLPRHKTNNYRRQLRATLDPDLMIEHVNLFRTATPKIGESNNGILSRHNLLRERQYTGLGKWLLVDGAGLVQVIRLVG